MVVAAAESGDRIEGNDMSPEDGSSRRVASRAWRVAGLAGAVLLVWAMAALFREGVHDDALHRGHVIHGSKGDDVLRGTVAGEWIQGLAGRDRIDAGAGDDLLEGGDGDDVLEGGPGDDTYLFGHHGSGADTVIESGGRDTLQIEGGRLALSAIELLRHGDDLIIRWNHDQPQDLVLIRSWFAGTDRQIETLQLDGGGSTELAPLAAAAKQASLEDLVHLPRVE